GADGVGAQGLVGAGGEGGGVAADVEGHAGILIKELTFFVGPGGGGRGADKSVRRPFRTPTLHERRVRR
ncbi:hypothetical protein, partial [Deinococcus pimensis]|uniref:hypothetical protein n=1 Tax=Deinococcus pimensis TaxID=309888 RepID=UPI001B7F8E9E